MPYAHMKPKIQFLEKDFEELSRNLTERYNPSQLSALANIGVVLLTMKELELEEGIGKHISYSADHMKEELEDAKHYYEKWLETKDPTFKQMAKDELRHADFFIKHNRMTATTVHEQEKIQKYLEEEHKLLELLDA